MWWREQLQPIAIIYICFETTLRSPSRVPGPANINETSALHISDFNHVESLQLCLYQDQCGQLQLAIIRMKEIGSQECPATGLVCRYLCTAFIYNSHGFAKM